MDRWRHVSQGTGYGARRDAASSTYVLSPSRRLHQRHSMAYRCASQWVSLTGRIPHKTSLCGIIPSQKERCQPAGNFVTLNFRLPSGQLSSALRCHGHISSALVVTFVCPAFIFRLPCVNISSALIVTFVCTRSVQTKVTRGWCHSPR